jgi:exopolyphosphatase
MGSNSFRLEIGRLDRGQIHRTEYVKETVRLGAGLDDDKALTPEAMARGWACLARFGERLAGFGRINVRAVATQTLREAVNRDEFVAQAEQLLGFPIEVIAGREEARLIYIGAARLLPQSNERRLVIDIGGRSTELILGRAYSAQQTESFKAGSVSWTQRFFANGQFTRKAFDTADMAAKALLADVPQLYPRSAWDRAYGSSGTIGAVAETLVNVGQSTGGVTQAGLDWLRERLIKAGTAQELRLPGIRDDRKPIIAGGVAVLGALLDLLEIDTLYPAQGALRQNRPARNRPARAQRAGARRLAARGGHRHLAQRLPQAWRLHRAQRRCGRLCHARAAAHWPAGAGPARQAGAPRRGGGLAQHQLGAAAGRAAGRRHPVPRAARPAAGGHQPALPQQKRQPAPGAGRARRLGAAKPAVLAFAGRRGPGLGTHALAAGAGNRGLSGPICVICPICSIYPKAVCRMNGAPRKNKQYGPVAA